MFLEDITIITLLYVHRRRDCFAGCWLCLILINIDNDCRLSFHSLSLVRTCLRVNLSWVDNWNDRREEWNWIFPARSTTFTATQKISTTHNRLFRLLEAQHSHPYGRAAELALSWDFVRHGWSLSCPKARFAALRRFSPALAALREVQLRLS